MTTGIGQGGGLTVAAAHLFGEVAAVMPDVPFLSNFGERSSSPTACRTTSWPITAGCGQDKVEGVFATLSYLDIVNHARRVTAPALFSVGLTDTITPPSTVFAAYNH